MNEYRLVNYWDVWGNEEEGWDVNDMCYEKGVIELPEQYDDTTIVAALIEYGFFHEDVTADMVTIQDNYHIEVFQEHNNKPECRLELIED